MERIIREMQKGFGTGHFDPALDRFFVGGEEEDEQEGEE
jgi:hypothetical protein